MSYRDTRQGRCYELSFLEALHGTEFGFDPDITLVHGVFLGRRHAWVVSGDDGAVCDMVTGFGWLSREAHERQGYEAKYLATYTRDEAIAKAREYGHFGPWDAENPALTEEYGDCDCAEPRCSDRGASVSSASVPPSSQSAMRRQKHGPRRWRHERRLRRRPG